MSEPDTKAAGLTRNQQTVLETLDASAAPMTAYAILDALRERGFRGPPQVYRALEKLQQMGMVHRLESLNAFVVCAHPELEDHETTLFLICERCGQATEHSNLALGRQLNRLAANEEFELRRSTVELRGQCRDCLSA